MCTFPGAQTERSKTGVAPDNTRLDRSRPDLASPIASVGQILGVNLVSCQKQHSGAGIDRIKDVRTLDQIPKRGQRISEKSVQRYEIMERLDESWRMLSPAQKAYFEGRERRLMTTMFRGTNVPVLPPRWWLQR